MPFNFGQFRSISVHFGQFSLLSSGFLIPMIELHCHTTFSDGTLTPTELVKEALAAGVTALAITDHDTMAGWDEAYEAAQRAYEGEGRTLEIVPGLELSTTHCHHSLHVLGFYPRRTQLEEPLHHRFQGRHRRAAQMAERLAELGYPITLPNLAHRAPGRPHIAQALVEAGHVKNHKEAFDRFIGEGRPAHVPYEKFSTLEGIQLLRQCGAIPVWAHPYLFRGAAVEACLPEFIEAGLMGLEVYHPHHSPTEVQRLQELCQTYGLLMTGGSDYHGPSPQNKNSQDSQNNTHTSTSRRHAPHLNALQVPAELLIALKAAVESPA
jgi:predicted metal-dependent phosphoesterase TrpH